MFLEELTPVLKKLKEQPVAFLSGLVSGVLGLNLSEDPLKSWLEKQGIDTEMPSNGSSPNNGSSPQSISIE